MRRKISAYNLSKMLESYKEGNSVTELSRIYNVELETIINLLKKLKYEDINQEKLLYIIKLDEKISEYIKNEKDGIKVLNIKKIIELHRRGNNDRAISEIINISKNKVGKIRRDFNLPNQEEVLVYNILLLRSKKMDYKEISDLLGCSEK